MFPKFASIYTDEKVVNKFPLKGGALASDARK